MPRVFRTGGVPFVVAWPILALCYAAPAPGKTVDGTTTRPTSGPALQVQDLGKARRNVLVERDGEWVNLTRFSRPQVIFEFAASADGRWAYVWHHERPPRVLSIYDVQSMELVCSFSPGAGGSLLWTPANTILHWWGGGTDCRIYAIYNVRGKTLCGGIAGAVRMFGLSRSTPGARRGCRFSTRTRKIGQAHCWPHWASDELMRCLALRMGNETEPGAASFSGSPDRPGLPSIIPEGPAAGKTALHPLQLLGRQRPVYQLQPVIAMPNCRRPSRGGWATQAFSSTCRPAPAPQSTLAALFRGQPYPDPDFFAFDSGHDQHYIRSAV
jgi:hypothetical protein